MNLNFRLLTTIVFGLAVAGPESVTGPGTASAQTSSPQNRAEQAPSGQNRAAQMRAEHNRAGQARDSYWNNYWNWYDSSYRPYYQGRYRARGNETDHRDRGYFGLRYGGEQLDDYQDWREDYYRDRDGGAGGSGIRNETSGNWSRRPDAYWMGRDRDYYRTPQYDVWQEFQEDRTDRFNSASPGRFNGYSGDGWR